MHAPKKKEKFWFLNRNGTDEQTQMQVKGTFFQRTGMDAIRTLSLACVQRERHFFDRKDHGSNKRHRISKRTIMR